MDQETMGLRVLAHFKPGDRATERIAAESDWLDVRWVAEDDDEAFYRELPEAEVLWHVLRPVSGADLEKAPKLKLIHKLGTGVNTIDVEAAAKRGIVVANIPGANAASVAECTVMLMLAALRRLPELDKATRAGTGWPNDPSLGDRVRDLGSCTVGLVGFGSIGKRVEQIVRSMGTQVLHTSTKRDEHSVSWMPLDDLLAKSDIVSIHAPLTDATAGLINAEKLAKMKPGAILINTARGGIVDQEALVSALQSGQLAAAGLDVYAEEPVPADNPLLGLDNVLLMPHVSWYTADTLDRYLDAAVQNCRRLRDGQAPYFVVNDAEPA
ncbi:2-hydroxyacid dehydrogenase [Mycolicibacterium chitae]|nr:2-hydroxyacid dehydrogenase [Mycolicibacterium chitae]MCV7107016.1 hydroxyacid dehydrogenase [Mycolicibacterium chitae]